MLAGTRTFPSQQGYLMTKRMLTLLGLALILAGCLALAYREIRHTRREKLLDAGSLQASMVVPESYDIPPAVGGLVIAGGVVLVVFGVRRSWQQDQ
jgi:hypothetical protein